MSFPAEVFFSRTYCTLIWSEGLSFEFCLLRILFPFVFLICHIEAENICLSTHPVGIAPYHQLYCRLPVSVSLVRLLAHFVFVSVVDDWFYCGNKSFFGFQVLFFYFFSSFPAFTSSKTDLLLKLLLLLSPLAVVTAVRPPKHHNLIPC